MNKRIVSRLGPPRLSSVASSDWSQVPERGHGVQFYDDDDELLRLLARYVGAALGTGDVAVVIATSAHLDGIARRLAARGFDVNVARDDGRYLALEAQPTLDALLRGGKIDEAKAEETFGGVLRRALATPAADGGAARVTAFGEVVALLSAGGRLDEALRLEETWNTLTARYPLTLCCAYPMSGFTQRQAAHFVRICAQHSHVFHAAAPHPVEVADLT